MMMMIVKIKMKIFDIFFLARKLNLVNYLPVCVCVFPNSSNNFFSGDFFGEKTENFFFRLADQ